MKFLLFCILHFLLAFFWEVWFYWSKLVKNVLEATRRGRLNVLLLSFPRNWESAKICPNMPKRSKMWWYLSKHTSQMGLKAGRQGRRVHVLLISLPRNWESAKRSALSMIWQPAPLVTARSHLACTSSPLPTQAKNTKKTSKKHKRKTQQINRKKGQAVSLVTGMHNAHLLPKQHTNTTKKKQSTQKHKQWFGRQRHWSLRLHPLGMHINSSLLLLRTWEKDTKTQTSQKRKQAKWQTS